MTSVARSCFFTPGGLAQPEPERDGVMAAELFDARLRLSARQMEGAIDLPRAGKCGRASILARAAARSGQIERSRRRHLQQRSAGHSVAANGTGLFLRGRKFIEPPVGAGFAVQDRLRVRHPCSSCTSRRFWPVASSSAPSRVSTIFGSASQFQSRSACGPGRVTAQHVLLRRRDVAFAAVGELDVEIVVGSGDCAFSFRPVIA